MSERERAMETALRDLLDVIAIRELIPESNCYMQQARRALAAEPPAEPGPGVRVAVAELVAVVDRPELMGHCATGCEGCERIERQIAAAVTRVKNLMFAESPAAPDAVREEMAIVRDALEQYARFDYYLFLVDPIGQQTDPTKKAKAALESLRALAALFAQQSAQPFAAKPSAERGAQLGGKERGS